jgi:hypothetical protein
MTKMTPEEMRHEKDKAYADEIPDDISGVEREANAIRQSMWVIASELTARLDEISGKLDAVVGALNPIAVPKCEHDWRFFDDSSGQYDKCMKCSERRNMP